MTNEEKIKVRRIIRRLHARAAVARAVSKKVEQLYNVLADKYERLKKAL